MLPQGILTGLGNVRGMQLVQGLGLGLLQKLALQVVQGLVPYSVRVCVSTGEEGDESNTPSQRYLSYSLSCNFILN